ncbi:hypothetical protein HYH03_001737 [Edaphochlamys debaryana]|uniref:Uncharacterized protein n=1 Tax=Edaphochlamys debaryana TaxID=47281 RepID=A0A836C4S5_9CHLO|nr:hypothetical protein HYH03_001737 [Edaphochlamys debaryana]|eukprot:KAG2500155.1 hypothetical protein HYH03_001737 [Edaphochlamys debaryana]
MTLAIQVVSRELGGCPSEQELAGNVRALNALLPDLVPGPGAKHADVARVAARLDAAAESLLALREALPGVNVSALAARRPAVLLTPAEQLEREAKQSWALLSPCGPAGRRALLEAHPALLDPGAAAALLDEIARLFGFQEDQPSAAAPAAAAPAGGPDQGPGAGDGAEGAGTEGVEAGEGQAAPRPGSARAKAAALLGSSPGLADAADCLRGQARGDRDPEYLADTTRAG